MTTQTVPRTFEEAQDTLARNLPAYTRRPLQEDLAAEIERALAERKNLLAEAGTGIGKSLAATIPAILSGRRTVVATATKALQKQYADKDMPFLQQFLGVAFRFEVVKGRANYLCTAQIDDLKNPTPGQLAVLEAAGHDKVVEAFAKTREGAVTLWHSGDFDELPTITVAEKAKMSISAAECPGAQDCPFARACYVERMKARAAEADIVITNTAMLAVDAKIRESSGDAVQLLGEYDQLIIDEAHNLASVVTDQLTSTMGQNVFGYLARDIETFLMVMAGAPGGEGGRLVGAADRLWMQLEALYAQSITDPSGKANPMALNHSTIMGELEEGITELYSALGDLKDAVRRIRIDPVDQHGAYIKQLRLLRRIGEWMALVWDISTASENNTARWLEMKEIRERGQSANRLFLVSAPITIGPFLRRYFWDKEVIVKDEDEPRNITVVMMSATLASGKLGNGKPDFTYVARELGLEQGEADFFDAGSPFDYPTQAMLYVPDADQPAPERQNLPAWRSWSQTATRGLVEASGGGALLLFTSKAAMEESYRKLAPVFEMKGLLVLKQGDQPPAVLVKAFKEDGNAVLFGLKTFMEGVDIQGRALRLVVLDKLPFAVPTDILHQARCERIKRIYNNEWAHFGKLIVPEMSLTLTQAFGRLIRHADDRGLVAIMDSRLSSKKYGPQIVNGLPPARPTKDIHEAMAFLAG